MNRTLDQNRHLWGRVSLLGQRAGKGKAWAEDLMRAVCVEISGKDSTSHLTHAQAERLIARLDELIRRIKPASDADATITIRQQKALLWLYQETGIKSPQGFCQRIIKKPWPQTRQDGIYMYLALGNMLLRAYPRQRILTMLQVLRNSSLEKRLNDWERQFITELNHRLANKDPHYLTAGRVRKLLEIWREYLPSEETAKHAS